MKLWLALLVVFAVLFTTRILLPLKTGGAIRIIEQRRPSVPQPIHETSLERERDEEQFGCVVRRISEQSNLAVDLVENHLLTSLHMMQSKLPFTFAHEHYNVLCLPEPNEDYQVHKRIYLGDSTLGVPIYMDVRVYDLASEQVVENLLNSIDGEFEQQPVERGVCFLGHGKASSERGHGFAHAQGERTLFFHLVEKEGRPFVAFVEAPRKDLEPLLEGNEYHILDHYIALKD